MNRLSILEHGPYGRALQPSYDVLNMFQVGPAF